jgi:hypothetical protein
MTTELTAAERGLIWAAFVFGFIALLMVICPYITTSIFASHSKNPELGGIAFGMTFGLIMMAFAAFSWTSSLVMLIINAICNRPALRTKLGISTVAVDIVVFGYAVFFAWQILKATT